MARKMLALGVLVGSVATALIGGIAWAVIPSPDGTIRACYDGSGNLKVLDEGKTCAKGLKGPLTWNQQGVPGADGVSGYEVVQTSYDRTIGASGIVQSAVADVACPDGKVALGGDAHGTITEPGLAQFAYGPAGGQPATINDHSAWQFFFVPYDHHQTFLEGDHIQAQLFVTCAAVN